MKLLISPGIIKRNLQSVEFGVGPAGGKMSSLFIVSCEGKAISRIINQGWLLPAQSSGCSHTFICWWLREIKDSPKAQLSS